MEQKRITLRIPIGLYEKLSESTGHTGKTLTGEILDRVNESFKKESDLDKKIKMIVQQELDKRLK